MKRLAYPNLLTPTVRWLPGWRLTATLMVAFMINATIGLRAAIFSMEIPGLDSASVPYDAWIATGREDANLNDLAILSEDHLVAVGDRGLIVGSDSSGRKWQSLDSPTTANLHGVRFLPSGIGLIVGGWIGANTHSSHAVILRSEDEGRSWRAVSASSLPRLTGLRVHENHCLAWGDYSSQWRTSLFESRDGGQTWRGATGTNPNVPAAQRNSTIPLGHASAGELTSGDLVGAVDLLGRACFVGARDAVNALKQTTLAEPWRPIHALHHTGSQWWAVGAQGELITSGDGVQWSNAAVPLSPAAQSLCRWQAITQNGESLWVCGYPGSILLHSPDLGQTWQVKQTGQTLPLSSIRFIDSNRGWATGPLGLMLATRDGGSTWYAQRQRALRLGVLAITRSASDIPWGPLAAAAWDEQVAVAATIYSKNEPIEQANFLPGHSAFYRDLAPQVGLAGVQVVSSASDRQTELTIDEQLAMEMRCWRPDIVLLGEAKADRAQSSRSLEMVGLASIKQSGEDNTVLSKELDLPPWKPTKLAAVCAPERSQYSEQCTRFLRAPGVAIWDCLLPLPAEDRLAAQTTPMCTIWTQSQAKSAFTELLGAIPLNHEMARQVNIPNIGNYQLVMGRVHRDKSIELLVRSSFDTQSMVQWASDLDFIMRTVPAREQAAVLQRLAQRLDVSTQWTQRQIVYRRLLAMSPQDDLADWARLEWLQWDASDECNAWRKFDANSADGLSIAMRSKQAVPQAIPPSESESVGQEELLRDRSQANVWNASPFGEVRLAINSSDHGESMVVPASVALPAPDLMAMSGVVQGQNGPTGHSTATNADSKLFDAKSKELTALGPMASPASLEQVSWRQVLNETNLRSPGLLTRPDMELRQYCKACPAPPAPDTMGEGIDRLERVMEATQLIGWPQMAEQENLLRSGQIERLRWTSFAVRTEHPPLLDGNLSESLWQNAAIMELTDFESQLTATQIRWAYDDKYLYIGIVAPCTSPSDLPPAVGRRDYDADLSGVDQVQLTLDTDRDYCTAIELAIAADGRTYDRCCGFSQYNPKWHVSTGVQSGSWTAELAVELADLTQQTSLAGNAWAVSARRIQPNGVKQSWSRLRSHDCYLQASGLLLFEPQSAGN